MGRLFEEDFVRRVAALHWLDTRRGTRSGAGSAGSAPAGRGFDLAGHRPYGEGDDLRALDWNALARLDEPLIRRFKDAEPREVWFAIDRSPSMQFGEPTKDVMARRLAGALGVLAVAAGGAVGIAGESLTTRSPSAWLARVEGLPRTGAFLPGDVLGRLDAARPREWILLCDPYEHAAAQKLLTALRPARDRATIALVTAKEDREPPERDAVVLDSESAERRTYAASSAGEFAARRASLLDAWRLLSKRHGASLTEVDCRQGWESAAAAVLASRGAASAS
jgi:uncharacterized protein (DUF58 family)